MKPISELIPASKKTCPNKPVFFGFVEKSENAQNRQKKAGKKIRRHMTRIRVEKREGGGKANFLEGSEMKVRMRNFQANRETKALCIYFVKNQCHGKTMAPVPRSPWHQGTPTQCQIGAKLPPPPKGGCVIWHISLSLGRLALCLGVLSLCLPTMTPFS